MEGSEPFPLLNTSAEHFQSALAEEQALTPTTAASSSSFSTGSSSSNGDANNARRRRKSSAIGDDIRAGDTGAPAFASSRLSLSAADDSRGTDASTPSPSPSPGFSSSQADHPKRISKRRRARGALFRLRQAMLKRTYLLPAFILAAFALVYSFNPTESNPVHPFIFLSYRLEPGSGEPLAPLAGEPVTYGKGLWDLAFVSFYMVVLSFTREFIMQELLRPLARRAGLRSRGKQARFMEQMYTAIYFGFLGPAGLYVMRSTPVWYFNTRGMYEDFPHRTHEAGVKFYYLFQAAYWSQQAIVLVLGLEKPRKDFKELVGHHVCTLALIGLSYRFHFTYMGLAVYTTHDISDFFLATSKSLNYVNFPWVDPYFVLFMFVWIYLRHFINLKIIWSILTEFRTVGPFTLDWATQQYKCWISQYITLGLLSALQALNLFWLFFIVRIAYRFVAGKKLEDDRSEVEDNDEDDAVVEEKKTKQKKQQQEQQKDMQNDTREKEQHNTMDAVPSEKKPKTTQKTNGHVPLTKTNGHPVEGNGAAR